MGNLFYGSTTDPFRIPDVVLAHVRAVTVARLRRDESFTLSWRQPGNATARRCTLWMHAAIPLKFVFDDARNIPLDMAILRDFAEAAHSTTGLIIDLGEPHLEGRAAVPVAAR